MLTPSGEYAIMKTADEAYKTKKKKDPPPFALPDADGEGGRKQKENREPTLVCPVCDDYANEAVRVPCCSRVYCDDCIRQKLLEEQVGWSTA
jgi:protein MPE1